MTSEQFNPLVQAIQLIAASYDVQIRSFPDFVHVPDEIALLLADNVFFLDELDISDPKNMELSTQVKLLDNYLANLDKKKFTLDALRTSAEWEQARKMAKSVLVVLNLKQKDPDLSWLRFLE